MRNDEVAHNGEELQRIKLHGRMQSGRCSSKFRGWLACGQEREYESYFRNRRPSIT
jgi:hypothetical protein